jgi:hypothetical protein
VVCHGRFAMAGAGKATPRGILPKTYNRLCSNKNPLAFRRRMLANDQPNDFRGAAPSHSSTLQSACCGGVGRAGCKAMTSGYGAPKVPWRNRNPARVTSVQSASCNQPCPFGRRSCKVQCHPLCSRHQNMTSRKRNQARSKRLDRRALDWPSIS